MVLLKKLVGTAQDMWRMRRMPTQVRAKDTRLAFTDIIGEDSQKGRWLRTGPILELMDVLAGTISSRVSLGPTATISFDRVDLVKPVFHGDLVRVEGEVIGLSNSSMAVQVSGYRHDVPTGTYFTVLNLDEKDAFKPIDKGLKIDEDNQHEMRMLMKAQKRLEFAEEDKNVHSLKTLEPRL
ncbi:hypothetical protein PPTG_18951 [Phytophthora nicotianae INRA-310]|uniref:HotDog ACOT-type domain-containing protein n=1 Tax=Phytophthora nicotianae (strain INRA-310) TaxID=761204 RepID=W2PG72_PHYN3|nr:hypothetical protein PPTG_18951 [Phytophthora nicotianae INRA-310]ETM99213.1 hypothetical protein PPTG_18951 [Phytophthora nicotianae INRA-310]